MFEGLTHLCLVELIFSSLQLLLLINNMFSNRLMLLNTNYVRMPDAVAALPEDLQHLTFFSRTGLCRDLLTTAWLHTGMS